MKRKTFVEGEAVEVVPDALGRRGAIPTESDWKPATYVRTSGRKWHVVKLGTETRIVPVRRIRKVGGRS